ncbi:hypothetical protein OAP83_00660 [Rickettsiales bacterium]|nr:hypothetical protein [Rickettsiales bacterium]
MAIKESKAVIKEVLQYWKSELESKQDSTKRSTFITKKTTHLEKLITQLDSDQVKPKDLRRIDSQINDLVIVSLKVKKPKLAEKLSQVYKAEEAFKHKYFKETYHDKKMLLSFNDQLLSDDTKFLKEKNEENKARTSNSNNALVANFTFSAFYTAIIIAGLALVSFPAIGIAAFAVAMSILIGKTTFDDKQLIKENHENLLLKDDILTDISKTLDSNQEKDDQIEQPPLQRELSNDSPKPIIETDKSQPTGQSVSEIDRILETEKNSQQSSRSR